MTQEIVTIETGLYMPSPGEAKRAMEALQAVMHAVLDESDYAIIRGKKWRKRTAFAKLRRAFSITVALQEEAWEDLLDGDFGCRVSIRAAFPNGRYEDGDGYCDSVEMRQGNIAPSRHNVRAKAYTRAKNRATADLLGTGEVSAEELPPEQPRKEQKPGAGARVKKKQPTTPATNGKLARPMNPTDTRFSLRFLGSWVKGEDDKYVDARRPPDTEQEPPHDRLVQRVAALMGKALKRPEGGDTDLERHSVLGYLFGVDSTSLLTALEAAATAKWLQAADMAWSPSGIASEECRLVLREAMKDAGQQELDMGKDGGD